MPDLIINKINVTILLKEKYAKLGQGWVTLLEVPIDESMKVNIEAIKVLQSMGYEGIYITLSKDYIELSKLFREAGIDLGKLTFIDGISQMYGIEKADAPNVTYVAGPISIDAISETISKIATSIQKAKKFVFLDSITTVLLYNSLERTVKFSQFLSEALKNLDHVAYIRFASVYRSFTDVTHFEREAKSLMEQTS